MVYRNQSQASSNGRTATLEAPESMDVGPTRLPGSLTATGWGWVYRRDGRTYYVCSHPCSRWQWVYDLEARLGHGRVAWRTGDPRCSFFQAALADELAPEDRELRREVRRDLRFLSWGIQFAHIDLVLRDSHGF